MQVDIDSQVAGLIQQQIESGDYHDATEVVREAVRLMAERNRRLQQLRAEIAIGVEQIGRGELIDFTPELLDELSREAEENARIGKPVKDAVKP
ncbi:MAG: type II toxin-antitoxin system ParD family antitoxin [Thermomicrobiales bacterium]